MNVVKNTGLETAKLQIIVRMYRALGVPGSPYSGYLGDCFLIRVLDADHPPAHILIDFGILTGSAQADIRMRQIARDIVETTGGVIDEHGKVTKKGMLDLLVITHEHWDHISGFSQARDIISDGLVIHKLWMAWTEDDDDATARQLRLDRDRRSVSLAALSELMQNAPDTPALSPFAADRQVALAGLDAFLGPLASVSAPATQAPFAVASGKRKRLKSQDIMQELKACALQTAFLSPGQVIEAPGLLKAFVLGPPRRLDRLKQDKPSSGLGKETYLDNTALEDLLFRLVEGEALDTDDDLPFSSQFQRIKPDNVRGASKTAAGGEVSADEEVLRWLDERYYTDTASDGRDQSRRSIDADWLGAAGPLAMKLDSDTNNTSLVLAFELPDQTFMLFPGDAQVGNWLSWHDQTYIDGERKLTATKILGQVRFLKVAHHGSHNASLKERGVDLMTHPDLIAFISTDEAFASQQGINGWRMPARKTLDALVAATKGRTFRNDDVLSARSAQLNTALNATNLYIEYTVL
ncbi:hypothetical protein AHFPHNDE_01671 [Pseudomonas sp. MM227]|uniref:MBL fold metallo-hydrolase n=1 Tax=Pseudomonas sp. MM227 TaxID=3019968 RepID=UPI00221FF863|nr:MBL fold metallo-hydrolase [Pseudomonas sp. MM227]CAI3787998.1 hypothetical protein AHFPHNDE_01671 [Pseudomonas sp. MM227]